MKPVPKSKHTIVLRTDFSDDELWNTISSMVVLPDAEDMQSNQLMSKLYAWIGQPMEDESYNVELEMIDDPEYQGVTADQITSLMSKNDHMYIFVFDQQTATHPDHPLLVIDLYDQPGRHFRAAPTQINNIESNLSISNMDWEDFSENLDEDGIFQGFTD